MIPLQFPSLRERGGQNRRLVRATLWVAAGIFACGVGASAKEDPLQKFRDIEERCKQPTPEMSTLKGLGDTDLGNRRCVENAGTELTSQNAKAITDPVANSIMNAQPGMFSNASEIKSLGACKLAYATMAKLYKQLIESRQKFCEALGKPTGDALECGLPSDSRCAGDWTELRKTFRDQADALKADQAAILLGKAQEAVSGAKDSYTKDRDAIAGAPSAGPACAGNAPAVIPANGGNRATCTDYFRALSGADLPAPPATGRRARVVPSTGKLISEESKALSDLQEFQSKYATAIANFLQTTNNSARSIYDLMGQAEKNDSPAGSKLSSYSQSLTGLSTLTGGSKAAPALTGASQAAPLAALAAVGAAGAVAAKSAGSGGSTEAPATAPTPASPASEGSANVGDTGSGGGTHFGGNSPLPNQPNDPTAKPTETATAPAAPTSEGSSRFLAGSMIPATPAKAPAASGGGGDASTKDDSMGAFKPNLDPRSAPRPSASNPAGEVANLLGQMKSLFNFDEPAGNAPLPPSPLPPLPGDAPAPGGEEAAADAPAPDANPEAAAESDANGNVQAAEFGQPDQTLFVRVHARHKKCMERGLVLYQLKERVE